MEEKLVIGLNKAGPDETVMICFPYAGGGASAYYRWDKSLEQVCRICPVQLPEREERMERAAALLRETDESVGEIAAEIGYSNAGRFSELFKREYGDTPLQYRMRQRGK